MRSCVRWILAVKDAFPVPVFGFVRSSRSWVETQLYNQKVSIHISLYQRLIC